MAKKKSTKLPKTIAGVKIPKKVRKQGGELLARVNTPLGRELLASGLVAAGAALANRRGSRKLAAHALEDVEDAAVKGARMASQIGGVVGAAASAALDHLLGPNGADKEGNGAKEPPSGSTAH